MTQYVLIAGDGYGCHLESGLKYTILCGRTFDPDDAEREEYEPAETHDDRHVQLCFDCHSVGAGGEISASRRERHFSRGGQA